VKSAHLVIGLGWGDEGKGATVDCLTRRTGAGLVVRFNGGPQAGHNVVTSDGRDHTFSQFGSGTFVPGVRTYLSHHMLVSPIAMMCEEEHLREVGVDDAYDRLTVDRHCVIVTPFHRAANRIEQLSRGVNNTCGVGVGRARGDHLKYGKRVLFAGDLLDESHVVGEKLRFLRDVTLESLQASDIDWRKVPTEELAVFQYDGWIYETLYQYQHWPARIVGAADFKREMDTAEAVIFEGAQGVLLDEIHGDPGFNTWTDTTFHNALNLLRPYVEGLSLSNFTVTKIGVIRSYLTRHGAGPFRTENPNLEFLEPHNDGEGMQGKFRRGDFDVEAIRRSLEIVGGVDCLAVNHLDQLPMDLDWLEECLGVPVGICGYGPTAEHRKVKYPLHFVNSKRMVSA
jgi:adenylosuccinate synthase